MHCCQVTYGETDALRVIRVQVLPKARTRVQSLECENEVVRTHRTHCVTAEWTYKHQSITKREKRRVELSENVHFGVVRNILTCRSFPEAKGQVSVTVSIRQKKRHTKAKKK